MTEDYSNMGSANTVSNSGHLVDYEFIPAVIVETDDPLHYGRIKCSALGAYNSNNSPTTHLPWCYPFTMTGNSSYSSYEKGSKVWLFRNKKRQDENWFIPMYELHTQSQEFVNQNAGAKPEIISMRNNGGGSSSITYDHGKGYNISTSAAGGNAGVNVGTNATTTVSGGGSSVVVNNSKVTLGATNGDGEPAVLGNKLKDFVTELLSMLRQFAMDLTASDPYTGTACTNLVTKIVNLEKDYPEILLSKNVTINEGKEGEEASSGPHESQQTESSVESVGNNFGNARINSEQKSTFVHGQGFVPVPSAANGFAFPSTTQINLPNQAVLSQG